MPRSAQEILDRADALAARFERREPDEHELRDAAALRLVREAFQHRADAERRLADAVSAARSDGRSWAAIGAMVGTSGEAARPALWSADHQPLTGVSRFKVFHRSPMAWRKTREHWRKRLGSLRVQSEGWQLCLSGFEFAANSCCGLPEERRSRICRPPGE